MTEAVREGTQLSEEAIIAQSDTRPLKEVIGAKPKKITRRQFLRGAAVAVAGIASAVAVSGCETPPPSPAKQPEKIPGLPKEKQPRAITVAIGEFKVNGNIRTWPRKYSPDTGKELKNRVLENESVKLENPRVVIGEYVEGSKLWLEGQIPVKSNLKIRLDGIDISRQWPETVYVHVSAVNRKVTDTIVVCTVTEAGLKEDLRKGMASFKETGEFIPPSCKTKSGKQITFGKVIR